MSFLVKALSTLPSFMEASFTEGLIQNFQGPFSIKCRSISLFLQMSLPLEHTQDYIRADITHGKRLHDLVQGRRDLFEMLAFPAYSVLLFAVKPDACCFNNPHHQRKSREDLSNALTSRTGEVVNRRGLFKVGPIIIQGRLAICVSCVGNMTSESSIRGVFRELEQAAEWIRACNTDLVMQ